jgi:hypothetical protein
MQAAAGCLWLKGGGPALTDEEAALPWSAFGLDLTGEARLRYHAAQVDLHSSCNLDSLHCSNWSHTAVAMYHM